MNQTEYKSYEAMKDHELFYFVTETAGSQRGHVARHILELRRNTAAAADAARAGLASAKAGRWAAIAAAIAALGTLVQAVLAILPYLPTLR